MPKYDYMCDNCNHKYVEIREINDPLFHPNCNACSNGKYVEVIEG